MWGLESLWAWAVVWIHNQLKSLLLTKVDADMQLETSSHTDGRKKLEIYEPLSPYEKLVMKQNLTNTYRKSMSG